MVRVGSSLDPGPVWLRQEAKRGAQWRLRSLIGEEIGNHNRHARCFSTTPPGLTGKTSANGGRRCMNLCRPGAARKRGQAGWRRQQIAYAAEKRMG